MGLDPKANSGSGTSAGVGSIPSQGKSHGESPHRELFFDRKSKWLNSKEAVEYLRLPSYGALKALLHAGRITASGRVGRKLLFLIDDLDRCIQASARFRRRIV